MDLHFDAIYENGVLRPVEAVDLPERARVSVTVAVPQLNAKGLNGCIGTLSAQAADEIRGIVERDFEKVDPRDW